jgi:amyloid beta precursor protein binding protein 1
LFFVRVIYSCRSGASDLPQIAALVGGLVSQEAIKLVTKQYIPLNGTCIFNGIRSSTSIVQG